jgi:hypothetical protein
LACVLQDALLSCVCAQRAEACAQDCEDT